MTEPQHSSPQNSSNLSKTQSNLIKPNSRPKFHTCPTECLPPHPSTPKKHLTEPIPTIQNLDDFTEPFHPKPQHSTYSDLSSSSSLNEEPKLISDSSVPIFQYRKKSKLDYTIKPLRAQLTREQTMGLSTAPIEIDYHDMKKNLKNHKEQVVRLLRKYKEADSRSYEEFIRKKVYDSEVKNVFNQFYQLNKKYSAYALVFFFNSYTEEGICRVFESFFLEFDSNFDRKIELHEMKKCFEFLAKERYVGKTKMKETFKDMNVPVEDSVIAFTEGSESHSIFSHKTYLNIFEKFIYKPSAKKAKINFEFVDFHKFAPLVFVFFLEYMIKVFLRKKETCQFYLGIPSKPNKRGKFVYDPKSEAKGIFRVFQELLKGETDIKKPLITYSLVSRALVAYRATGLSDSLSMEAIERILKDVKILMGVDLVSGKESRKFSMKELLPIIASKIFVEVIWSTADYKKGIEKYDDLVTGVGGTLCEGLSKTKLDRLLKDAFANLPFPSFKQFVKGLDFILHRAVPTWVSPAAIFIANGLMDTPEAVLIEEGLDGNKKILFNIEFIVKNDDLFERLHSYTLTVQLKLVLVRLLYKNHYSAYKRNKKVNRHVHAYNEIICDTGLFEDVDPGIFGKFEDLSLNLVKLKDPKTLKKEEKIRKELKMRRYLELLMHRENKITEKKNKKWNLKKFTVFKNKFKTANENCRSRMFELQVEANKIDMNVSKKEQQKMEFENKVRESSAFPNSSFITPEIIHNFIKNSSSNSKEIRELERFIYVEKEKITFQDIHKFIVNQHLKKASENLSESVFDYPTMYVLEENEKEEIKDEGENSFEEKYFSEMARKREKYFQVDYPEKESQGLLLYSCIVKLYYSNRNG